MKLPYMEQDYKCHIEYEVILFPPFSDDMLWWTTLYVQMLHPLQTNLFTLKMETVRSFETSEQICTTWFETIP